MIQEAVKGWCGLHLAVAVGLCILGLNWWQVGLVAFGFEIFQFFKAKAAFINPGNSLLDIGSYVLWAVVYTKFIGWSIF